MGLTVETLALTCVILLAAGYVLFIVLGFVPSLAPIVRDSWPILFTETLIVGTAAGSIYIGGWVLTLALLAHAIRTGYEAAHVTNRRAPTLPPIAVGLGIAGLAYLASFFPIALTAGLALIVIGGAMLAMRLVNHARNSTERVALDLLVFPTVPLIVFTAAGLHGGYEVWLLVAFILVETFDSYALLGGKFFGRHKAFPVLSPRKTVEGLVIGAVILMLTAGLVGAWLADLPWSTSCAIALFTGILTVTGDLTASRLKRLSSVKDFPKVLPHQGGLLDITDAWIASGAGLIVIASIYGFG